MIISLITIISVSLGVITGLVGGGVIGYTIGDRRRIGREISEDSRYFVNSEEKDD